MIPPFKTAIIDPPWPYTAAPGKKEFEKKNGQGTLSGFVQNKNGVDQYKVLSLEDLSKLPVGDLVSDYIFLWVSMPFLPAALRLIEDWGFEYKTGMCWGKWKNKTALEP